MRFALHFAESKAWCGVPLLLQLLEIVLREELLRVLQGGYRLRALVQVLQLQKSERHAGRCGALSLSCVAFSMRSPAQSSPLTDTVKPDRCALC